MARPPFNDSAALRGPPPALDPVARARASRRAAAVALRHVLERRQTLDQALDHALARTPGLDPRDRQLARAITTFALKRLGSIRAALDARLKKTLAESPADFGANLIVGAAQILTMAVPAHAAVDLAVTLTAADRTLAGLTGVVNAVLRRIADERDAILAGHDPRIDLPAWLIARWDDTYGRGRATAIAAATAQESTLDVTALADPARWAEALGGRLLANGSIRLDSHAPVQSLQGYEDGVWFVQDAAAAAPAPLLRARPGERVLDLCAAPGGKTAQLAATGADVTAIDRSAPRLKRVAENLARLKLSATLVAADAATWDGPPADAILLDAPCAGTGTIRRHPDIAWTKTPEDVATLAALQTKLLDRAAALLRPGGRLVYSTCSLEPEEGERQIAALLARRPDLARDPVRPGEAPGFDAAIDADGALRTTPEMWPDPDPRRAGLDGFYAARVRRAG